jgi:hypothetical protein
MTRRISYCGYATAALTLVVLGHVALEQRELSKLQESFEVTTSETPSPQAVITGTKTNETQPPQIASTPKKQVGTADHIHLTCPTMLFTPRSEADTAAAVSAWNRTVEFVRSRQLSFLTIDTLQMHFKFISEIESKGVSGMIVETGVAKAGSSLTFAAIKSPQRCLHLFDTFEGIPPPSDKDGKDVHQRFSVIKSGNAGQNYYGYMKNLMEYDFEQFVDAGLHPDKNNVFLHKGLFHDTVWPGGSIAYAHLDGDWYESTYEMLERIVPWLSPDGGILTLDDVQHYSGARQAFEDYFKVGTKWLVETHGGQRAGCVVFTRDSKRYALFIMVRVGVRVVGDDQVLPQCQTA